MDNSSVASNSSGTNGIICASVVQYGHGFLRGDDVFNSALAYLLFQIIIVTTASRLLGRLLVFVKEPLVIAEMIVGIIFGPTVMGRIPGWSDTIFPCHSVRYLKLVSSFGLVLFMFVVGVEIDIQYLRKRGKHAIIASLVSCSLCFVFAVPLMFLLHRNEYANDSGWAAFYLFVGIVMAISALPVLARILSEYKLLASPLGTLAIGTATVDDLIAWPMLAVVMSLAGSSTWRSIVYEVVAAVLFIAALFLLVRPLLKTILDRATRQKHDNNAQLSHFYFFLLLAIIVFCSWSCEILGLTAFIGAMGVGLVMPRNNPLVPQLLQKIEDISVVIFLPLYFTVSGLRTQLGYISTGEAWALTILLIVCASIPKMFGCALVARFVAKCSWRESSAFAILINSKGLVALVAINLGLQNAIITPKMFSMFVVLVLANTILAAPVMYFIQNVKRKSNRIVPVSLSPIQTPRSLTSTPNAISTLQTSEDGKPIDVTLLIYTADSEKAPFLISVASAYARSTKRKCRSVFVRLISPELRPSLIMSDVTRDLLFRDDVVKAVRARATVLSLPIEVHCEFSSEPFSDLIALARNHYQTPLLITDLDVEKMHGNSDQMDVLRSCTFPLSMVLFPETNFERSDIQVEPNEKVLRIFPSPIFSSYYQQILRVDRVLLPYMSNRPEEFVAFEMTLLLADHNQNNNMEVDVLCTAELPAAVSELIQQRMTAAQIRFQFVRTNRSDIREALKDLLLRSTYSLMVIGDGAMQGWIREVPLENLPVMLARFPPPPTSNV